MQGKGDKPRIESYSPKFRSSYDRIFGQDKKKRPFAYLDEEQPGRGSSSPEVGESIEDSKPKQKR